jgi:hypothetical protein
MLHLDLKRQQLWPYMLTTSKSLLAQCQLLNNFLGNLRAGLNNLLRLPKLVNQMNQVTSEIVPGSSICMQIRHTPFVQQWWLQMSGKIGRENQMNE